MKNNTQQQLHPFGHGGDLQTAAHQAGVDACDLIDFSASINPLGPPAGLFAHLADSLQDVTAYPDPACRSLCAAIRARYPMNHHLVPGNGAGELIYLVMRAIPAGSVLVCAPTFALYEKGALAADREVYHHTLQEQDGFALNVAALCDNIRRIRPTLTVLCNPNNPTGHLLTRDEILAVAAVCAKLGGFLLVDEAFLEFCPDWRERTLLGQAPDNVLVLYSMTKLFAIPGLRLGFLAAPSALAQAVSRLRDPWSVSTLAQRAGEYVLRDQDFVERSVLEVGRLARDLAASLMKLPGLRLWAPTVNYLFMESLTRPSHVLQQELLCGRVLVRDCGNFVGLSPRYIRVAVRTELENQKLTTAMHTVLTRPEGVRS
jgi:threonine-phosphate decarboxylase